MDAPPSIYQEIASHAAQQEKPNFIQFQLLVAEVAELKRDIAAANGYRALRHLMEQRFHLETLDGLGEKDSQ